MEERLQKIMAQAGIGSRRDCEVLIISKRVTVNGVVAIIGQKADPKTDKILVDGNPVKTPDQKVYIALNKPRMVLSTVEAEPGDTRQTVRDLVPVAERLYPVGRLDFDSEGLVLMTNDGNLAQRLTHPSYEHEKEYRVLVASQPDEDQLGKWRRGVVMEDGYKTLPAEVRIEGAAGKGSWLRVIMREGRKRQIREIGSLIGLPVVRIVRIRIGSVHLGQLKSREWRYLTAPEVAALMGETDGPRRPRPSNRSGRRTFTHRPPENTSERPPRRAKPDSYRPSETTYERSPRGARPVSNRPSETTSERPPRRARPDSYRPSETTSERSPRRTRPNSNRPSETTSERSPRRTRPDSNRPSETTSERPPRRTRPVSNRPSETTSERPPRRTRPVSNRPSETTSERSPRGARPVSNRPSETTSDRPPRRTRPVSNRPKK